MSNLLPLNVKQQIVREYWTRVVVVWLAIATLSFLAILLLKVPTLLSIQEQLTQISNSVSSSQQTKVAFDAAVAEITQTNELATYLDSVNESLVLSELTKTIQEIAADDITFQSIQMQREESGAIGPIRVTGVAGSRESLGAFQLNLLEDQLIDGVDLPLSNLAKDEDIPFSLTINLISV